MVRNLIEYDPPKMLTLREARVAGQVANRLTNLRDTIHNLDSGSVTIKTRNGTQSLTLPRDEIEAVIGLLIERDVALLTGLNVETSE